MLNSSCHVRLHTPCFLVFIHQEEGDSAMNLLNGRRFEVSDKKRAALLESALRVAESKDPNLIDRDSSLHHRGFRKDR